MACEWYKNPSVYPSFAVIVEALQDPGVAQATDTKLTKQTGVPHWIFLRIAKIATQVYKKLKEVYNPTAQLDDNVSGKEHLNGGDSSKQETHWLP